MFFQRFDVLLSIVPALLAFLICPGCGDPTATPVGSSATPDTPGYFEIRVGERVRDWCDRLEQQFGDGSGLIVPDCRAVRTAAAGLELPDTPRYAFVPGPAARLNRFEGLFVPGQYSLRAGESVADLIARLLEASADRLAAAPAASTIIESPKLRMTEYRQLTLASIVEKEAASNREYDRVAAVFLNRLKQNDVLGSCPTVEYALGYHRPFLLFKDLEIQSPYNVYKRRGLPPTPIAFFSDGALAAVRQPADTKDFFFVFDWTTGDLHFAEGYGAHKRNAAAARKRFIAKFGDGSLYKRYDDLFYELPREMGEWADAD